MVEKGFDRQRGMRRMQEHDILHGSETYKAYKLWEDDNKLYIKFFDRFGRFFYAANMRGMKNPIILNLSQMEDLDVKRVNRAYGPGGIGIMNEMRAEIRQMDPHSSRQDINTDGRTVGRTYNVVALLEMGDFVLGGRTALKSGIAAEDFGRACRTAWALVPSAAAIVGQTGAKGVPIGYDSGIAGMDLKEFTAQATAAFEAAKRAGGQGAAASQALRRENANGAVLGTRQRAPEYDMQHKGSQYSAFVISSSGDRTYVEMKDGFGRSFYTVYVEGRRIKVAFSMSAMEDVFYNSRNFGKWAGAWRADIKRHLADNNGGEKGGVPLDRIANHSFAMINGMFATAALEATARGLTREERQESYRIAWESVPAREVMENANENRIGLLTKEIPNTAKMNLNEFRERAERVYLDEKDPAWETFIKNMYFMERRQ